VIPLAVPATAQSPGGLTFVLLLLTDASEKEIADVADTTPDRVTVILAGTGDVVVASDEHDFAPVGRSGVLRVEVSRIDDAIETLSALIVTRWRLQRAVDALVGVDARELRAVLLENARQLRDMRAAILRVRMVSIASMLDRLPLVVRGLARTTGKQAQLVVEAGGAEVDKTVGDRIFPALVHLLRNAIDHGIEPADVRVRAGKPPHGTIRIVAVARDRRVELRIEDDGRGVDRAAVARRAGVPVPDDSADLLDLMCRSGLSTRAEADTTSGRGVGLDIVRKVIVDGLGGELTMSTVEGGGTTFILRVPLTIAIVDAFIVACADQRYVVPVPMVDEIVELGDASGFFVRRGETVPIVDLAASLGADCSGQRRHALVVRRIQDEPVAFAIDRILGQQEAVIRPLADPLVTVPGVTGSTDLGDGRASLVLDLHGLVARLEAAA